MALRKLVNMVTGGTRRQMRTLGRTIAMAGLVGLITAFGAAAFQTMSQVIEGLTLERLAHFQPGGPAHETQLHALVRWMGSHEGAMVPWLLVVIPAAGGLASGFLVFRLAPEAEGHGTDAAIRAYHHHRGRIRLRVPLVKMLASAITLGTGGSGGREGPISQIGAGFGSFVATKLKLSDAERRTLMLTGLGAGIGAIFHAPLAGAIFAIEVLYRDPDFESEALVPAFIGTTVAYSIFSLLFDMGSFSPLFEVPRADLAYAKPLLLLAPLAVLALAMAGASWLYVQTLYRTQSLFTALAMPRWMKPGVGGALTGLAAVSLYGGVGSLGPDRQHQALAVMGYGYGFLQDILMHRIPQDLGPAAALLLVVGLGKIVTTSLTIGSGGAGGAFGPSMVIGGTLGAVVGVVFHAAIPGVVAPTDIVIFTILGMAGFFAAAANTPVSTLIMVSELCNSYALLLPSMWVCAISYLVSRRWTLYREQVGSRRDSPAHRGDFIIDILQGVLVHEAVEARHRAFIDVRPGTPIAELSRIMTSCTQDCFAVVDERGEYQGLFSLNDLRQFLYDSVLGDLAVAHDLATPGVEPLTLQMDLSSALSRFAQDRFDELPVVDEAAPRRVVAMLRRQDVIALYDRRLLELRGDGR